MGVSTYDRSRVAGGHNWWVRFTPPGATEPTRQASGFRDVRPCGKSAEECPNRRFAERLARRIESDIASGKWEPTAEPATTMPTVEDYAERWIAQRKAHGV